MKKEYVSYGIIGIVTGLIFGFLVANWTFKGPSANDQVASNPAASASVNSGGPNQQLPANHPPIDSGQTIPAPPLPPDAAGGSTAASTPPPTTPEGSTELPSLDAPATGKEERTEQKYKNIQLLKGLPADRLMPIMFAFKASLGVDCTYCHIKDQFEKDDKPTKQMARKMISIVRDTNAKLGTARVACFTCHRGQARPPQ
jgi:hypothetical protein